MGVTGARGNESNQRANLPQLQGDLGDRRPQGSHPLSTHAHLGLPRGRIGGGQSGEPCSENTTLAWDGEGATNHPRSCLLSPSAEPLEAELPRSPESGRPQAQVLCPGSCLVPVTGP